MTDSPCSPDNHSLFQTTSNCMRTRHHPKRHPGMRCCCQRIPGDDVPDDRRLERDDVTGMDRLLCIWIRGNSSWRMLLSCCRPRFVTWLSCQSSDSERSVFLLSAMPNPKRLWTSQRQMSLRKMSAVASPIPKNSNLPLFGAATLPELP